MASDTGASDTGLLPPRDALESATMPEPMQTTPPDSLFAERKPERTFPATAVSIAAVAVVLLAAVLILLGQRHGSSDESASYAPNVQLGDLQMSESESLSGGKSTYIDGHIANRGPLTVTGVTVRVSFPTDSGATPQTMTVPVQLIRAREPYVDVQAIRAAPLKPGSTADFRLIFEGVSDAWNQQPPTTQVLSVSTR